MSDDFPSRALDKILIRAPDGLRDTLKELAAEAGRSLNAEIVQRLEWSLQPSGMDDEYRADFVQGVIGGFVEALLLDDDPKATLSKFRERMKDPIQSKAIAEAIVRVYSPPRDGGGK